MNFRLRRGGRLLPVLLGVTLGLALGATGLVWTRTQILNLRYELSELLAAQRAVRSQVEKLSIEAAVLRSPERLERRALELGLRYPAPDQTLLIDDVAAPASRTEVAARAPGAPRPRR